MATLQFQDEHHINVESRRMVNNVHIQRVRWSAATARDLCVCVCVVRVCFTFLDLGNHLGLGEELVIEVRVIKDKDIYRNHIGSLVLAILISSYTLGCRCDIVVEPNDLQYNKMK